MQQKEIRDMLRHVETYPQSAFSRFIFNTNNKASDLIDFMMWVEGNTIMVSTDGGWERYMVGAENYLFNPETYDTLIQKYLAQLN
jgi:hypothetical protein